MLALGARCTAASWVPPVQQRLSSAQYSRHALTLPPLPPLLLPLLLLLQRLIVVANRLPVSAYKDRSGRWQLQVSAGGLVSALMGVGNFQTKWIGWPGGCCCA